MDKKESFILYTPLYEIIKDFSDHKLGELFRAILKNRIENYQGNDLENDVKIAFKFIQNQFRLDDEKYLQTSKKRSESGKLGGRPKKQTKAKKANGFFEKQKKLNDTDTDTENDTEKETETYNENENNTDIKKTSKKRFTSKSKKSNAYPLQKLIENKEDIIKEFKEKFPELNVEYAVDYFISRNEARDYKYTDYKSACRNWLKENKGNQFSNIVKLR